MLQQCNDSSLYDVIMSSRSSYEALGGVRTRYLSSVSRREGEVSLRHPGFLVSLNTERIKISNQSECTRLKSLCSVNNSYRGDDLRPLGSLERLHSCNDKYEQADGCLFQTPPGNRELQYLHVYNILPDSYTFSSLLIQDNV